jgi:ATP-binding cassette subfamily B protein/subfamily B ATP-binding cassette protein MsbA
MVAQSAHPKKFPINWQSIEFRNVSFRFDKDWILKNINLTIRRGELVAIVGSSGGGKSTLVNLLPRFFDPTEGEILVDNIPIKDICLTELRSNIALVSQDVFLFGDSIERNIHAGDFDKNPREIVRAAKLANADTFISKIPSGYQSRVGDMGSTLSGGEKQRISIARAIFKDAPVLVLDEATSALDSESELEVQKGLDQLMAGRTAFVIAHRLSTIAKANRILVISKGEIIEQGSHHELLAARGEYAKFLNLQQTPMRDLSPVLSTRL